LGTKRQQQRRAAHGQLQAPPSNETFVGRAEAELNAAVDLKKRRPKVFVWLTLALGIVLVVYIAYHYWAGRALEAKIAELQSTNSELRTRLSSWESVASLKFPNQDREAALSMLLESVSNSVVTGTAILAKTEAMQASQARTETVTKQMAATVADIKRRLAALEQQQQPQLVQTAPLGHAFFTRAPVEGRIVGVNSAELNVDWSEAAIAINEEKIEIKLPTIRTGDFTMVSNVLAFARSKGEGSWHFSVPRVPGTFQLSGNYVESGRIPPIKIGELTHTLTARIVGIEEFGPIIRLELKPYRSKP
jgi:hypothetical protein